LCYSSFLPKTHHRCCHMQQKTYNFLSPKAEKWRFKSTKNERTYFVAKIVQDMMMHILLEQLVHNSIAHRYFCMNGYIYQNCGLMKSWMSPWSNLRWNLLFIFRMTDFFCASVLTVHDSRHANVTNSVFGFSINLNMIFKSSEYTIQIKTSITFNYNTGHGDT
jgi:hypothetical protein